MTTTTTPTTTDTFETGGTSKPLDGTPTAAGGGRGGLPAVLLQTGNARVVHGDDPGDFYCEHAFFTSQQAAELATSSVVRNAKGERLVGFLHVPRDAATDHPTPVTDQAGRHKGTRDVVGAALRGMVEDAAGAAGKGPVRVLLTGYLQWGSVQNNPTGDFVSHQENLDAAMANGFGKALLTPVGTRVGGDADHDVVRYRVRDPLSGRKREVLIEVRRLPVSDDAIDGGPQSLQTAIAKFGPHAVINMGVHGGADFIAEHHADDGGIDVRNGRQVHDDMQGPRTNLPDNFALPRAIQRGGQRQTLGGTPIV